jgi:hypothetical protein
MRGRGVIILVSDLYDDEEEVAAELRRAARMGHDVTIFHVLTHEERQWTWRDDIEAVDSETGQRVIASPEMAQAYQLRVEHFIERWRARCVSDGILYVLAPVETPPADTLKAYLLQRGRGSLR